MVNKKPNFDVNDLKKFLNNLKEVEKLTFETLGKLIEQYVAQYFLQPKFAESKFIPAKNKNEFPDLKFILGDNLKPLAMEIKSSYDDGRHNSANDLGSIDSWKHKLDNFSEVNFLYIIYSKKPGKNRIQRIYYAPFYDFMHVNPSGSLKYCLKNANLRPRSLKDFGKVSEIKNVTEFKALLKATDLEYSRSLLEKAVKRLIRAGITIDQISKIVTATSKTEIARIAKLSKTK